MTPSVLASTGIQAIQPVNTAGLVDLGPDAGMTIELLQSLAMTLSDTVKVNVSVHTVRYTGAWPRGQGVAYSHVNPIFV